MGRQKTNIEALLIKYILLHGKDKGEFFEIEVSDLKELAATIQVDYAAMTRRINESDLIEKEPMRLKVSKD